jgi:hypothetical protein
MATTPVKAADDPTGVARRKTNKSHLLQITFEPI